MRLWLLPLLTLACFLLAGCPSYSLYPLYTDEDAVVVPALEGTWVDTSSEAGAEITFQKSGARDYTMVAVDPSTKVRGTYEIRLLRLGNQLFMDLIFSEQALNGVKLDGPVGVIATHETLKVEISEDDLAFATLEDDAIKKQSNAPGNSLEYRITSSGALLVTAPTETLRRYVAAHAGDAFSSFDHLKKKREQKTLNDHR